MWENDICLCASKECPRYDECVRGNDKKKEGVYTISFLRECCNQNNNYIMFIKSENNND